ncbi:tetratricopeptide repeat protein [uncultured Enterovirga sp.]|uniref:tetratricopeptide repeat protein n=1 Tax=uncultured Enterovirga sp. TaxID=2026352 RepID=UPI0035CB3943
MSSRWLQPVRPRLRPWLAAALVALSLGGCMSRNAADTTGSIGSATGAASGSEGDLRREAVTLARRYDEAPNDPAVALAYARVLRGLGQTTQAVAVLQQAALRTRDDPALLSAYGKALADVGRFKEAATVLSSAHRPERPDWRILSVQGAVADQGGDFASAQRYYVAALRIAPGEPSILTNQGLSFALARRLDEAERALTEASRHPRADARVRQNLALVLGLQGKFAEAETVLKRDLGPTEVATNMAAIRRMVSQANSWKAIRQSDQGARAERQAAL